MNLTPISRWTALAALAAFAVLVALPAQALTDTNAELKEAAADREARVVIVKAVRPMMQTVWVPVSAKRLDSFKPVLPPVPTQVARK